MKRRPDEDTYTSMNDSPPRRGEFPDIRDTDNPAAERPVNDGGDGVVIRKPDEWDEGVPPYDTVI